MTTSTLNLFLAVFNVIWVVINFYNFSALAVGEYTLYKSHRGKGQQPVQPPSREERSNLPKISILLAAYHEMTVLPNNLRACLKLNYPRDRMELIVVTEEDDRGTRAAIRPFIKRYKFIRSVIVPKDSPYPRGKPRALDIGLLKAKGSIIGVLDAEDVVSPNLLQEVAQKMTREDYDVVQGILDPVNDESGWFSLMERAEYGYWYRHYLYALSLSGYPLPLGGTTNFIRKSVLDALGGWETGNLTEDFELGLKIYNTRKISERAEPSYMSYGGVLSTYPGRRYVEMPRYKVGLLNSITKEEAPSTWQGWHRQRTRWQQGKLQTLENYARNPPPGFLGKIHIFLFTMQPHIVFINLIGISLSVAAVLTHDLLPLTLAILTYINFCGIVIYSTMNAYGYLQASKDDNRKGRMGAAIFVGLSTPVYWIFQWISDMRAAKREYVNNSTEWFKTEHTGPHMKRRA